MHLLGYIILNIYDYSKWYFNIKGGVKRSTISFRSVNWIM